MTLAPYLVTALSRNDIPDTPTDRNVVIGAVVEFRQGGVAQIIYDDESGSGGSTQKVTDSNGQLNVWVEPGEYQLFVNGIEKTISVSVKKTDLNKIKDLSSFTPEDNAYYVVNSFYDDGINGGGTFKFDSSLDKSLHNGINVIDPVRVGAWNGTITDIATYYSTGTGLGCFVRSSFDRVLDVECSGAITDGSTDSTVAVENGLKSGVRFFITKTVRLSRALVIDTDNAGLLSDKTGFIYAPSSDFNQTDITQKYATNAMIIDVKGELSGTFTPVDNIKIEMLNIYTDVQDNRVLNGISARNVNNLKIKNCEIYNLPVGVALKLNTITGNSCVSSNIIRDMTSNIDYSPNSPQISAIEVDDDRINSMPSDGVVFDKNKISDITCGPVLIAAHGYQADGINITNPASINHKVVNNNVNNTGEGIDSFGDNISITNNYVTNCYFFGIKLVNGASNSTVNSNTVSRCGLAGITLAGSNSAGDTTKNTVSNNTISDIDPGNINGGNTYCISTQDNGGLTGKVVNCIISNNILDPGNNGGWCIGKTGTGENNSYPMNTFVSSGANGFVTGNEIAPVIPANKTVLRATMSASQSIPNGSTVKLEFDTVTETRSEFDTVLHRYVADCPGWYRVKSSSRYSAITSGSVTNYSIRKNNAEISVRQLATASGGDFTASISDNIQLNAGDYIEVFFNTGDSVARSITNNSAFTFLTIEQIA